MYDSPTDGQLTTNLVMNENSCTVKYIGLCLTGSHDCPHLHCIDVFSIMLNKDKHSKMPFKTEMCLSESQFKKEY